MQEQKSDTIIFTGLKNSDLAGLINQFGKNIFRREKQNRIFRIIWEVLKEPMFLLLFAACSLYFILGKSDEGFLMLSGMFFVAAISVFQELKSSKALEALKQYTEPKVTVIRDGNEQVILSENLLPGDIMILEEGNRIPADAVVIQSNDLTINESILTGESAPVDKSILPEQNKIFQGTTINSGKCYARVTSTGNRTVLGKLGKAVDVISSSKTLLQEEISRFIKIMATFGFTAFLMIWLINYIKNGDLLQSLLLGLTLAMSAVPEEIPVAFSSFMALGAVKMARLGIITRQAETIENLGAVSVICLDKTGTITENRMQVKKIYDYETKTITDFDQQQRIQKFRVLRYARLASERAPFDAMEKAIVEAFQNHVPGNNYEAFKMVHEYPLGGQPPMMTHVYAYEDIQLVAGKGAPERILRICKMKRHEKNEIEKIINEMASSGYRVLGVCSSINHSGLYPDQQDDFNWQFEGLVALYDPPKANVSDVFAKWHHAGINIKLLTGDFAETAKNIAGVSGISHHEQFILGEEVMQQSPAVLQETVKNINIYARMFPEAKLKVVEALKENKEIVAMTGDGINDGPALKSAQIGIAMGNKGSEIAKEAADLIITDDNLDMITEAIRHGRKIYNNFKKAIRYIISIHIPIILTASLPLILGWKFPNIFTPIHIIFLELIMGPTCSIFYEREPEELNIMHEPPRARSQNIFSWKELLISIIQGLVIASALLSLYYYFMSHGYSIEYVRTVIFTTLILSNVFLTFVTRSFKETFLKTMHYKNSLVPYIILISAGFLASIYFINPLQFLFHMTHISAFHYLICVIASLICTWWFELYKAISPFNQLK
ncbi:MAG TPA: cation-translocating P-type ATPase [Puia sp.]|nr:cation-translocating P-type ATPase [Puia sp.]